MHLRYAYSKVGVEVVELEDADGHYEAADGSADGQIKIDTKLHGLRFAHAFAHEAVHHWEQFTGKSLSESTVDSLSGFFVEILFASGLVDADEFEKQVRALANPQ